MLALPDRAALRLTVGRSDEMTPRNQVFGVCRQEPSDPLALNWLAILRAAILAHDAYPCHETGAARHAVSRAYQKMSGVPVSLFNMPPRLAHWG
jgi:hypothetical protein